jgi:Mrp family chromosome partitioning ATPase
VTLAATDLVRVVTCAGGAAWEAPLVQGLQRRELGVDVVRRCVDHGELLGIALRDRPHAAIVSAELPWLDRELVGSLHDAGVTVIAIETVAGLRPLDRVGINHVLGAGVTAEQLRMVLATMTVTGRAGAGSRTGAGAGAVSTGASVVDGGGAGGRLVVVWGTAGAPGRTTVAWHLAEDARRRGASVLLVDGDGWAPSVAQRTRVAEAPAITKAARLASDGWPVPLATCVHTTASGLSVLAGLPRADLWPEVRERAWRAVLDAARACADVVIVDIAAPIDEDEELAFDRAPYRRNLMSRVALGEADVVTVVATGDPIGIRRLVFAHRQLVESIPSAPGSVVVALNRVPAATTRQRELVHELERWSQLRPVAMLPAEPALERCVWEGRPLHDLAPRSRWLRDLRGLSVALGAPVTR